MRKLQFIKAKLKDWNKDVFGDLKEEKNNILSDISRIDLIPIENLEEERARDFIVWLRRKLTKFFQSGQWEAEMDTHYFCRV